MDSPPAKNIKNNRRTRTSDIAREYLRHIAQYRWLVIVIFLSTVAIQGATLASPWFLRQLFNVLASHAPSHSLLTPLLTLVGIIGGFYLLERIAMRIQDLATIYLEAHVMTDLFGTAFEYLIGHSYDFFISHFAGSLTHRVTKFARAFETMFDGIMLQFVPTFLFVAGAVIILTIQHWVLGLALGIWSVLFVVFQVYASRKRQPLRAARAEADTRVTGSLADAISNHATITLFSGKEHEKSLFGSVVDRWRTATFQAWLADSVFWGAIGLFVVVIEIGLLAGAAVLWTERLLTIGDFVLIQSYLLTTFDRLVSINRELRRFYDAYADASDMIDILNEAHGVPDRPGARDLIVSSGTVDFTNVSFFFHEERTVFDNFSLAIGSGEKVALVGPSGAGKSTITRLLLRMYDVSSGAITIDGQNIADITQDSLRAAIAYVPQEPILFHRSLLENIRYGRRSATDDEVIEAAKQAHCHEFITALPEGYGTYVGERGVKLSGGERQRVALARAFLKQAPILVLDEATSSLDSESEALIQESLAVLMAGKTTIVIAHRLSTIMKMDRIVVLEHGQIAAEGTHDELLNEGGLYHKLWSIQAGGFLRE